jgi:hypothetical protein
MVAPTLKYIKGEDLRVWLPEGGAQLRVEIAGDRCILSARIKRIFPLSRPEGYLSIQDDAGKEVGM